MKKIFTLFLIGLCMLNKTQAQWSRSNNKSSNVYRGNYQRMASGCEADFTMEIRNGSLWAWGDNSYGQLGDGTTTNRTAPVQIGSDTRWVRVACGASHTIAIKSDGTLWAWGNNSNGQLGDGTTIQKNTPVQIGSSNTWISIACGYNHTAALASDGQLWAWGDNSFGQLGDGTYSERHTPVQQEFIGSNVKLVSVACGANHTIVLTSGGYLYACGDNSVGQYGNNTQSTSSTLIEAGGGYVNIAAGNSFSIAIMSNGTIWATGDNYYGELGLGRPLHTSTIVKQFTKIGTDTKWVSVVCGESHVIALKSDGTLWSWGSNGNAQLGDGTTNDRNTPAQVGTDNQWSGIASGSYHILALKSNGTVWTCGDNSYGQLGNSTTNGSGSLVQIRNSPRDWLQVVEGSGHTVALKNDGTLWAWGFNTYGQLGDGSTSNKTTPVQISTDNKWVSISGGGYHNLALKSDGTLWAWGYNADGQLGDGTTTNILTPTQIGTNNTWVSISAGGYHSMALQSDGTLWAWGYNAYGQLGNGFTSNITTPTQIASGTQWLNIAAAGDHTIAIKSDGTLWAWGYNLQGQLGDGTTTNKLTPTQIGTDIEWLSICGGNNHSVALKADGTLWAWGYNNYGQLGDGTNNSYTTPEQIGTGTAWMGISCGAQHTVALKSDGTLWTCGYNLYGQLGDGTTTNKNTLSAVAGLTNVVYAGKTALSSNTGIISATRANVCLTGNDTYGQLGDGSTTNKSTFNCSNNVCRACVLPTVASTSYTQPLAGTGNRTDFQSTCSIVASITPSGATPVLGTATAIALRDASVQTYNGEPYVQRHYDVLPATNPNTATATITLYFLQTEFNAYNAVRGSYPALPTGPTDATGIANIRVSQFHGTPSGGYTPSNYPTTWAGAGPARVALTPSSVIWNTDDSRWEVTVSVTGFSGFFLFTNLDPNAVLPLTWLSLSGKLNASGNASLYWVVEERDVANYTIERSSDGVHFTTTGSVSSLGDGRHSYSFTEGMALRSTAYYRIQQRDIDGNMSYSQIIKLTTQSNTGLIATLYPNPVQTTATLELSTGKGGTLLYQVVDATGRNVQSGSSAIAKGVNVLALPTTPLPEGIYLFQGTLNDQSINLRFLKQ